MLTGGLILIGIALLIGIWYNGKHQSDVEHEADTRGAEAKLEGQRVDSLEKAAAESDAERKAKDEEEAAQAASDHTAVDFLRKSFRRPR